jgi:hypothetical protein
MSKLSIVAGFILPLKQLQQFPYNVDKETNLDGFFDIEMKRKQDTLSVSPPIIKSYEFIQKTLVDKR